MGKIHFYLEDKDLQLCLTLFEDASGIRWYKCLLPN